MLRSLSEEVFVIKNIKNTVTRTYIISDLNSKGIVGTFYEKEFQKVFRVEKVIKKKGNKLCVGWEGYDSCFNSWIDKKDKFNERISSKTKIFRSARKSGTEFV